MFKNHQQPEKWVQKIVTSTTSNIHSKDDYRFWVFLDRKSVPTKTIFGKNGETYRIFLLISSLSHNLLLYIREITSSYTILEITYTIIILQPL